MFKCSGCGYQTQSWRDAPYCNCQEAKPMTNSVDFNLALHGVSLNLAILAKRAYNKDQNSDMTSDLMNAYRDVRRHIDKGENGNRFGAGDAARIMQSDLSELFEAG